MKEIKIKNKYIYLTLLFASTNYGHAILIGDEESLKASKNTKNTSGADESYTESLSISSKDAKISEEGNATLFKIDDDKVIAISAAHCVKTLDLDLTKAIILSREKKQPSGYNISLYSLPGIKVDQRFFDKENDNKKHIYDFAMSNFLMPAHSPNGDQPVFKNGYFNGGFYNIPLQHQKEYAVKVRSFGPSFDNQLTSYSNYIYHEVNMMITYDQEGYFYKKLQSRDFYFKFTPKVDGSYDWYCDLLPGSGDVITDKGDSGSLMTTHDDKKPLL
ncbi:MAG: hypothetical protein ACRYGR_03140 [Janthinobacterium lividum]